MADINIIFSLKESFDFSPPWSHHHLRDGCQVNHHPAKIYTQHYQIDHHLAQVEPWHKSMFLPTMSVLGIVSLAHGMTPLSSLPPCLPVLWFINDLF